MDTIALEDDLIRDEGLRLTEALGSSWAHQTSERARRIAEVLKS